MSRHSTATLILTLAAAISMLAALVVGIPPSQAERPEPAALFAPWPNDGTVAKAELRAGPDTPRLFLPLVGRQLDRCSPRWADDFGNPSSGWPIEDDAWHTYAYVGGEYQILGKGTDWALAPSPGRQMADGVIVANMRFAEPTGGGGDNGGIMFGQALNEPWSLYRFTVERDGWFCIQRHAAGLGWVELSCGPATGYLPYPAANQLKVVREGAAITAYINGQFLATVSDSNYLGSLRVGLSAGSGTNPADLRFDDYAVYPVWCKDEVQANGR